MKPVKSTVFKPSSRESEYKKNSIICKQNKNKSNIFINDRYLVKTIMFGNSNYKIYKGIDLQAKKYVTIYIKPASKQKNFSKKVRQDLKQKVTPPQKQIFTTHIDKNPFDIEVHQRYGPSLEKIISHYKNKISQKTFFLLSYQFLKLVSKIDTAGYAVRNLNPKIIICHEAPERTQLFLLNSFELERKNEQIGSLKSKYCSIGSHLGLKVSSKDTLQSMCYILMDIYLQGKLFYNSNMNYEATKSNFQPEKIPTTFLNFFYYIKNLNLQEQVKFTEWKATFRKQLEEQDLAKPYEWNDRQGISDLIQSKATGLKSMARLKDYSVKDKNQQKIKNQEQDMANKEEFSDIEEKGDILELNQFQQNLEQSLDQTMEKFTFDKLIHNKSYHKFA